MKSSRFLHFMIGYFLRGLLFVAPLFLTVYAIYALVVWLDGLIPGLFPGLGLMIILCTIVLVGFLSKLFLFNYVMNFMEQLFSQAPVTRLIYSSVKDLFSAFIGDKKKMFSQPVLVTMFKDTGIGKLGFVTKEDLSGAGLDDFVAVYFPHSYNFSGNMYLVPKENIRHLPQMHGADAMKFIVSGGVTELNNVSEA